MFIMILYEFIRSCSDCPRALTVDILDRGLDSPERCLSYSFFFFHASTTTSTSMKAGDGRNTYMDANKIDSRAAERARSSKHSKQALYVHYTIISYWAYPKYHKEHVRLYIPGICTFRMLQSFSAQEKCIGSIYEPNVDTVPCAQVPVWYESPHVLKPALVLVPKYGLCQ